MFEVKMPEGWMLQGCTVGNHFHTAPDKQGQEARLPYIAWAAPRGYMRPEVYGVAACVVCTDGYGWRVTSCGSKFETRFLATPWFDTFEQAYLYLKMIQTGETEI